MNIRYVAGDVPDWIHPDDEAPPLGTKILILTIGGVCTIGTWSRDEGAIAWRPLPKLSIELRLRLASEGVRL